MKKNIAIILFGSFIFMNGQVGINTSFPSGQFHVDGGKDNSSSPTLTMQDNDVTVTEIAKVGIGTINPATKLHISSATTSKAFRLADGTQDEGRLLSVLNTQGDVGWADRILAQNISSDGNGYSGSVSSDMAYINRKVTLDPGEWLIRSNLLIYANIFATVDKGFYARFSWAEYDGSSYFTSPDVLSGSEFGGPYMLRYGIATGNTIISNTTSSPKTYYLVTRTPIFWGGYDTTTTWIRMGADEWGETSIIAYPVN